MEKNKLLPLGVALIVPGILVTVIILGSQAYAQETKIDLEKLKQILNETRAPLEANDDPGALTQLDLADQLLNDSMSVSTNTTNTEAIVTG